MTLPESIVLNNTLYCLNKRCFGREWEFSYREVKTGKLAINQFGPLMSIDETRKKSRKGLLELLKLSGLLEEEEKDITTEISWKKLSSEEQQKLLCETRQLKKELQKDPNLTTEERFKIWENQIPCIFSGKLNRKFYNKL